MPTKMLFKFNDIIECSKQQSAYFPIPSPNFKSFQGLQNQSIERIYSLQHLNGLHDVYIESDGNGFDA